MQVAHKAFLDLENGLAARTTADWRRIWKKLEPYFKAACLKKDWHEANKLIDTLNTDGIVSNVAQYAQTIGMASMLLGASRLGKTVDSHVAKHPPARQLGNGVMQWGAQVSRNAPKLIRQSLHKKLADLEHRAEQSRHTITKAEEEEEQLMFDLADEVEQVLEDALVDGDDFMALTASLMVSRLSSFGFLAEAQAQGIEKYKISAVLDDHTCPVCEALDGKVFDVKDGVAIAGAIMDAEDADSLKLIAPWPSQSKDNVSELEDADAQDLVDQGLQIPPYHPGCRCIADAVSENEDSSTAAAAEDAADDTAPTLSLGVLLSILGITEGALDTGRKHRGADVVGNFEDDDLETVDEPESFEDDGTPRRKKKSLEKSNPYHDAEGRFTTAEGAGDSVHGHAK